MRDGLDFESNFDLSIIYAETGEIFSKFWKNLEFFWPRIRVIKNGWFRDKRDDRDD